MHGSISIALIFILRTRIPTPQARNFEFKKADIQCGNSVGIHFHRNLFRSGIMLVYFTSNYNKYYVFEIFEIFASNS